MAPAKLEIARQGTIDFQARMWDHQYGEIYDASSKSFKSSVSRKDFLKMSASLNRKLGSCKGINIVSQRYTTSSVGDFVNLVNSQTCEKGVLTLTFTWQIVDQKAILYSVNFSSPALLE